MSVARMEIPFSGGHDRAAWRLGQQSSLLLAISGNAPTRGQPWAATKARTRSWGASSPKPLWPCSAAEGDGAAGVICLATAPPVAPSRVIINARPFVPWIWESTFNCRFGLTAVKPATTTTRPDLQPPRSPSPNRPHSGPAAQSADARRQSPRSCRPASATRRDRSRPTAPAWRS